MHEEVHGAFYKWNAEWLININTAPVPMKEKTDKHQYNPSHATWQSRLPFDDAPLKLYDATPFTWQTCTNIYTTALTEAEYKSKFEPKKDIPYLALTGS